MPHPISQSLLLLRLRRNTACIRIVPNTCTNCVRSQEANRERERERERERPPKAAPDTILGRGSGCAGMGGRFLPARNEIFAVSCVLLKQISDICCTKLISSRFLCLLSCTNSVRSQRRNARERERETAGGGVPSCNWLGGGWDAGGWPAA